MVRRAPGNLPPVQPRRRYGGVADLVPYQRAPPSLGSDLHVGDVLRQPMDISKFAVVMDTDVVLEVPDDAVEVLPDDYVLGGDDEEVQPSTNCTGIVWVGSDDMVCCWGNDDCEGQCAVTLCIPYQTHAHQIHTTQAQPTEHQWNDANPSPRRTSRLHFTCNMCGHRNEKLINPRAWEEGTVFARCDGCSVVHKLKDNLNLIDEIVYNRDEEEDGDDDQHPGITATSSASPEVDDATAAAYSQGLPRTPFVVGDLVVPPGLVVEPEDPLCN